MHNSTTHGGCGAYHVQTVLEKAAADDDDVGVLASACSESVCWYKALHRACVLSLTSVVLRGCCWLLRLSSGPS